MEENHPIWLNVMNYLICHFIRLSLYRLRKYVHTYTIKAAVEFDINSDRHFTWLLQFSLHPLDSLIYAPIFNHLASLSQDQNLLSGREVTLPKSVIIENAKMCIDHRNGFPLKLNSQLFCYPGPGQINQHRKKKRQCLGLHTYPIDLQPR